MKNLKEQVSTFTCKESHTLVSSQRLIAIMTRQITKIWQRPEERDPVSTVLVQHHNDKERAKIQET